MPDGKNPQAFNRYSYTSNNPIKYIDPSGHMWQDLITGGGSLGGLYGGGGSAGEGASFVYGVLLFPLTVAVETVDTVASGVQCAGGDGWACVGAAVPFLSGAAAKGLGKVFGLVNDAPMGAADEVVESLTDAGNTAENAIDSLPRLKTLSDDEILFNYSKPPSNSGKPRGFRNELRSEINEGGISCQIASLCNNDPVQGYRQQFGGREPSPGNQVRQTTVGKIRHWGGIVDPDGGIGDNPIGHATIYSRGGAWGDAFESIWGKIQSIP